MKSVAIQLHSDLAHWLELAAAKRNVSLECAILQLLEEERMRDIFVKEIEVPIGEERWTAKTSMRGLMYSGYDFEWTRMPVDSQNVPNSI